MADISNSMVLIEQADRFTAEGRWEEARNIYHGLMEESPESVNLQQHVLEKARQAGDYVEVISRNMVIAELLVQQGEFDQARLRYKDVIDLEQEAKSSNNQEFAAELINLVAQVKAEIFARMGCIDILEGKADEAINWLRPSLDLDPSRWDTHMAMGRAYMAANRDKEAIGEFQEVVRLAPSEAAQAYEMLGEVFIRAGRPSQSTVVWFRNAGELFVQRGELRDAMRTYERILQFEPRNKDILIRLATIYSDEHINDKAAGVYGTLASLYDEEGMIDKVVYFYERLLECMPDNVDARERLMQIYEEIVNSDPTNTQVRGRLSDCLILSGRLDEAAEHKMYLARGYFERNMLDECYGVVCQILEVMPNHIDARCLLGDLYKRREMNTEALNEYLEVVRLYRESGNETAALDFQHKLVAMFPEATDLKYQVTLALRSQGDREGAARELLRILSETPDDMIAKGYLGEEYAALGRWDEAVKVYRSMLQLDASRTDVRKRLIKHFLETGELNEALSDINSLSDDDPEKKIFFYRIIEICIEHEQYEDVERYVAMLKEDDERIVEFRKVLLNRYLQMADLEHAENILPLIPRTDKDRNGLVSNLLEQYIKAGKFETVASVLDRLPEDDPLRVSFRRRLIGCYQDNGRLEEAKAELERLPENDELRHELIAKQISSLMSIGRIDDAIAEIDALPEDSLDRNSFMGQIIEIHLQNGNIDRAAEEVAKLGVDTEFGARYRRRLVQAYLNENRLDEAERDILALDDSDPEKHSFLRMLLQRFEANGMLERLRELALDLPDTMVEKQQYIDGVAHSYLTSGDLATGKQEVYRMAESISAAGNHYEAGHLYAKLLAWHPVDVDIRLRMSQELAAQGQLERAREGMLILAGRFHIEGNTTSAADIYSRLLEIDPDNLNARYRLGDIWAEQGQTAQALEQFACLAKVYLQQNLPEVAQRVLNRILELDPKDVMHRRQLIQLLTRNLRFEEATEHHRRLLEIFLERGELEESRACVREIVTLQPLNLDLRQRLGEMFLNAGFLEEGQGLMEELASTYKGRGDHANVVKVFTTLSKSFEDNQQWDTALEYLERVADEQVEADNWPLAQENYVYAIKMYLLRGRKENVDPLFVRLVDGFFRHRSVSQGVKLLENLEKEFTEQGRLELALVIKDRLASVMERLSEWSKALDIVISISNDCLQLEDSEQAINYCRRAADLALNNGMVPKGIELLYRLMSLTLDVKGYNAITVIMDEIRQRANGEPKMIERMGDILFKNGLLDEAREVYNEVLAINPDSVAALSRIAVVCARDGRLDEVASIARRIVTNGLIGQVVNEYSKVIGSDVSDAMYHIRMGEFYQQIGFLDEAIVEFHDASRDPAKTLLAVNNLALAFSQKGYSNLAIRQLVKTLDQPGFDDFDLLDLRYNLAQILEKEGRLKDALQAYQECYAVDICFRDVADRIDDLFNKVDVATYNSDVFNYDDEF